VKFEGKQWKRGFVGWRAIACGAFGARHAVPLLKKRRQNDVVIRAKHWELWRVLTLAQAEAYAPERQLRRPEASGTKNESERTMSRCVLV